MVNEMEMSLGVPVLVFGDLNRSVVARARRIGLGSDWVEGDPMKSNLDAIVSPANTVGEMSGGYDLVIRNRLGTDWRNVHVRAFCITP